MGGVLAKRRGARDRKAWRRLCAKVIRDQRNARARAHVPYERDQVHGDQHRRMDQETERTVVVVVIVPHQRKEQPMTRHPQQQAGQQQRDGTHGENTNSPRYACVLVHAVIHSRHEVPGHPELLNRESSKPRRRRQWRGDSRGVRHGCPFAFIRGSTPSSRTAPAKLWQRFSPVAPSDTGSRGFRGVSIGETGMAGYLMPYCVLLKSPFEGGFRGMFARHRLLSVASSRWEGHERRTTNGHQWT